MTIEETSDNSVSAPPLVDIGKCAHDVGLRIHCNECEASAVARNTVNPRMFEK